MVAAVRTWSPRRWWFAALAAAVTALVVGVPTDVIPNPVFGRPVPVTPWAAPVLALTAVLGGLLAATYVREPPVRQPVDDGPVEAKTLRAATDRSYDELDRLGRAGGMGGMLSFFAVGCPVCNKLVVLALGTVGARRWFEPLQPALAVGSIVLLVVALRARLRSAAACPQPRRTRPVA